MPTHLDLFSGIGGFAIAAQRAGFETIGFAEIAPYPSAVLAKRWPGVINYGDVRAVPRVACDLLTGGFPCQPFSQIGKRRGKADDRNLWPSMLDVIRRCKPTWILGENVPGITEMELLNCIADLEILGYRVQPFAVPACAVDAKHRRNRIWIVANAKRERLEGQCQERPEARPNHRPSHGGDSAEWTAEPGVGRVVHGLPCRVDRITALGNSIVPQVAEVFLQNIRELI